MSTILEIIEEAEVCEVATFALPGAVKDMVLAVLDVIPVTEPADDEVLLLGEEVRIANPTATIRTIARATDPASNARL